MFGSTAPRRSILPFLSASLHQSGFRSLAPGATRVRFVDTMPPQRRHQSTVPEGYKEDASKGAMLRFEDSLPRLPVPTLEETAKRYLKSVHPLLSKAEFSATQKAVEEFVAPGGFGQTLQKRLIERREEPNRRNWLAEWWDSAAYLSVRDPVVPYVSYFYSHRDDRKRRDPAKRAAAITTGALAYKKQVDDGTLEPEYMKKRPIAMISHKYMFNCCRIPAKPEDYPKVYPAAQHKHIVVVRKNAFFKVIHEFNGQQLNAAELESQFNRIYRIAETTPAVGVLTSENRDKWADMRQRLIDSNSGNKAALETIESAAFVVCLDDAKPVTLRERALQYWAGDGCNRWFDKPIQFIINDNGTSGFCGEHSMMDGTPTHRLNDTILGWIANDKLDLSQTTVRSDLPDPQQIRFQLSSENLKDIGIATADHLSVMGQHELHVEAYQGYGKGLIKQFKCSPDGYVQMIIQLAYKKLYGKNRPTYESAATRRFQEGRTETCRSVSDESVAFCDAMVDPQSNPEHTRELFQKALKAQGQYILDASDGKGVDRHLFGLKRLVHEGEQMPSIFTDLAYGYSSSWYLSTSQLSSEYFNGYGWSQVIDQGFGIAYMINENSIQFNIVSKKLGCERMAFYLNEAAGDMRDLMMPTVQSKAKL